MGFSKKLIGSLKEKNVGRGGGVRGESVLLRSRKLKSLGEKGRKGWVRKSAKIRKRYSSNSWKEARAQG